MATPELYTYCHPLSLHAALPIYPARGLVQLLVVPPLIAVLWTAREVVMGAWPYSGFPWARLGMTQVGGPLAEAASWTSVRSEEHTSELQSLMRSSYAVFCLKKKTKKKTQRIGKVR